MGVFEAIAASERLCRRGDLTGATRVLGPHIGDRTVDLQRGAVLAEGVLLDGFDPSEVESILTPHLESGRAIDLIGLAHHHSAITSGEHGLGEAVGECMSANRLAFDQACWRVANTLHIGMIQQALGSHDVAEMYLRDAYRASEDCAPERALAAFHLGRDAFARGSGTPVPLLEEALHIRRTSSLDARVPETLVALAEALEDSRAEEAGKLADEAVERARDLRVRRPLALALASSGRLHRRRGDLEEGLDLADRLGDVRLRSAISHTIENF